MRTLFPPRALVPLLAAVCGAALLAALLLLPPRGAAVADEAIRLDGLKVTTYPGAGPTSLRIDLVILGDGYVKDDYAPGARWGTDAARLVKNFFDKLPFKDLRPLFNVHLVEVVSLDRGADDAPGKDTKRTALNCTYGARGIQRLLVAQDEKAVVKAAANAPAVDIILILVNDPRDGGSGGETPDGIPDPVCSIDAAAYLTAIHELGHSVAGLGDEYVDDQAAPTYPMPAGGADIPAPNLTLAKLVDTTSRESVIRTAKWGRFLRSPALAQERGWWEGGYYRAKGIYRPSVTCTMADQTGGGRWCFVCLDAMTRSLYRIARRGPTGGLPCIAIEDAPREGALAAALELYEAGKLSRALAEAAKVEKKERASDADREGAAKVRKAVDDTYEAAVKALEEYASAGDKAALKEYLGLAEAAFKGTPHEKELAEKKKELK